MASTTNAEREEDRTHPAATTIPEQVAETVKGEDRPMEEVHPQSPGALVFITYPAILIAALLVIMAVIGFWYGN